MTLILAPVVTTMKVFITKMKQNITVKIIGVYNDRIKLEY